MCVYVFLVRTTYAIHLYIVKNTRNRKVMRWMRKLYESFESVTTKSINAGIFWSNGKCNDHETVCQVIL